MNIAHKLGIAHAQEIATRALTSEYEREVCKMINVREDLHDRLYPYITDDWFGNDDLRDDYWTAFWITWEDLQ